MRWDFTSVAAGAAWITATVMVGAETGGVMDPPRVQAVRHLALVVAAVTTIVHRIEKRRHTEDLIFQMGRTAEALERDRNVVPLRVANGPIGA